MTNGHTSDDEDFEFLRSIIYKLSRISLGDNKKSLVLSRISKRIRMLNLPNAKAYCEFLRTPSGKAELSALIDVISTNHTYFFRESSHFDYLSRDILYPRRKRNASGVFRVWSSACSSGEEPYSVAMILEEERRLNPSFDWKMEATDISSIVLAKAQAGKYPDKTMSRVPGVLQDRYLMKDPSTESISVKPSLKTKIHFSRLNLFEIPNGFPTEFDLILCRNVMIYFDRENRESLVNELTRRLHPAATLFVGHSESLGGLRHSLRMIKPAIYVKMK